MVTYTSISNAYLGVLSDVYYNPDYIHNSVQQNNTIQNPNWCFNKAANAEKINYSFIIEKPSDAEEMQTKCETRNKIIKDYSEKETILFDKGDRVALKDISQVWKRIQNPDGTVNANYGYMVYHLKDAANPLFTEEKMSQWEWAKNRLLLLKKTNQAYIHFNRPKDQWNENLDQPCCMFIQFQIRDDKLNLVVHMRSNDLVYGFPYNILYFVKLMHRMISEVKFKYNTLSIGNLIYYASSIHYYTKHKSKVEAMLGINDLKSNVYKDILDMSDVDLNRMEEGLNVQLLNGMQDGKDGLREGLLNELTNNVNSTVENSQDQQEPIMTKESKTYTMSMTKANKILTKLRQMVSKPCANTIRHYGEEPKKYSVKIPYIDYSLSTVQAKIDSIKKEFDQKMLVKKLLETWKCQVFALNIKYGIHEVLSDIDTLTSEKTILEEVLKDITKDGNKTLEQVEKQVSETQSYSNRYDMQFCISAFDEGKIRKRLSEINKTLNYLDEHKDKLNISKSFTITLEKAEADLVGL
jgi:thymidylate synthase